MRRRNDLTKHTLNLRAGDFAFLSTLCVNNGIPTASLLRKIVSNYVDRVRAKEEKLPDIGELE